LQSLQLTQNSPIVPFVVIRRVSYYRWYKLSRIELWLRLLLTGFVQHQISVQGFAVHFVHNSMPHPRFHFSHSPVLHLNQSCGNSSKENSKKRDVFYSINVLCPNISNFENCVIEGRIVQEILTITVANPVLFTCLCGLLRRNIRQERTANACMDSTVSLPGHVTVLSFRKQVPIFRYL